MLPLHGGRWLVSGVKENKQPLKKTHLHSLRYVARSMTIDHQPSHLLSSPHLFTHPPNHPPIPSSSDRPSRLRNDEHSRLQEMRLQHAEDIDKASRRKAATLASLARQAELDREDWARRAKDGASAGGEEVRERAPHAHPGIAKNCGAGRAPLADRWEWDGHLFAYLLT